MNRSRVFGVIVVVVMVITATVVLLSTGGSEPVGTFTDPPADTALAPGAAPPQQTALADITSAEVRSDGSEILFIVSLNQAIPNRIEKEALEVRWDVTLESTPSWIVAVNFDLGPVATVSSLTGQNNYLASTSADTFPGSLEIDGAQITVRLAATQVPSFPGTFNWVATTRLDGAPGDAASATVGDRAPNAGFGEYPS